MTGIGNGSIVFLSTPQRGNVALTRARHCLWIVGNGDVLRHSSPVWDRLVMNAKVVFDDDFLKSMIDLKNPESCKEVHSVLMKVSGGWRVP